MDLYMPSEIARLVLGYLRETGCVQTVSIYLKESPHLVEYAACLKQGHEYPTKIGGHSLIDLLSELCARKVSSGSRNERASQPTFAEVKLILERLERSVAQLLSLAATGRLRTTRNGQSEPGDLLQVAVAPRSASASVATSPSLESPLTQLADDIEIVSNDVPTIRIEEASSTGTQVECATARVVSVDKSRERLPSPSRSTTVDLMASSDIFYCSRIAHSTHTTPTSRPLDIYSSPTSIARSALIFSLGIEALQTPGKEIDDNSGKSPRRKNQLPRKRLTYTPSSSTKKKNQHHCSLAPPTPVQTTADADAVHNEDSIDVSELFGQLLNSTALHECIAANINRVVCSTSGETQCASNAMDQHVDQVQASPTVTSASATAAVETVAVAEDVQPKPDAQSTEHLVPDNVVKDIVDRTESDPLFEAFINIFFDKQDGNPPDSGPSETASPDTHGTPLSETMTLSSLGSHSNTPSHVIVADTADMPVTELLESSIACAMEVDRTEDVVAKDSVEPLVTGADQPSPAMEILSEILPHYTQAPSTSSNVEEVVHLNENPVDHPLIGSQILVNDLQLESSIITTEGGEIGDCGVGMTRTMTFTVLQPMNGLHLQEFKEPCQLKFITLSPTQLLSLNSNTVQGLPSAMDSARRSSLSMKSSNDPPDQDAVKMALRAQNQPRRCKRLNRPSLSKAANLVAKCGEDDRTKQPVVVEADVSILNKSRKRPKHVCAVPLNFTNSNNAVSLLEPLSRKRPPAANIVTETGEPTKINEIRSPQLRSLLSQSAKVMSCRGGTSFDQNHVRVLNFGARVDCGEDETGASASPLSTRNTLENNSHPGATIIGAATSSLLDASSRTVESGTRPESNASVAGKRKEIQSDEGIHRQKSIVDANRKRAKTSGSALATMDVEKFLLTVQYVD